MVMCSFLDMRSYLHKMAKPLLNDLIARDMLLVDEAKEVEEIIATAWRDL